VPRHLVRTIVGPAATTLALAIIARAPLSAQAGGMERDPKTAAILQRESGHNWDLNEPKRVAAVRPLKTRAFRAALDAYRDGKADLKHDISLSWGEFLSGLGEPFLAIAMDRPVDADLQPGTKATLFGELLDANGAAVTSFETDTTVELTAGHALIDASLPFPKDVVRAVIGVAQRGAPRWLIEQPLSPSPIDARAFGLSRPILSLDVHPLPSAQKPDDPFCFGGMRVAPRGDRTFHRSDAPWLFAVARVPGSVADGAPQLAAALVIKSDADGKTRRYPIGGLAPTALKGFEHQWGLGVQVPISGLAPGSYQVSLEVSEKPAGTSGTTGTSFTVVE
jgi:hypothetical protein